MFEALGTLRNLKLGMIIDGPNKGEVIFSPNLHIIELEKHEYIPFSCDPLPAQTPLKFQRVHYYKCYYFLYNKRYYAWSVHNPEYWRSL